MGFFVSPLPADGFTRAACATGRLNFDAGMRGGPLSQPIRRIVNIRATRFARENRRKPQTRNIARHHPRRQEQPEEPSAVGRLIRGWGWNSADWKVIVVLRLMKPLWAEQ